MKTTNTTPAIASTLEISTVAKWIEDKQHKFTLRLTNTATGETMTFPYSGGCLAFLPKETPQNKTRLASIRAALSRPVRTIADAEARDKAMLDAHALAKPDLAGVLHSLLCDMDAGAESFREFCDSYGYEHDSRKAYKTWETCQEIGKYFRRVARAHIAEIREALADY